MQKMIFINLPVRDLAAATAFYTAIGGRQNMQFSDETASCMVFSDAIFVMLLTHAKFSDFAPRPMADPTTHTGMLLGLTAESREAVNALVTSAAAAGGVADVAAPQEHGFMYLRSFCDPDGHVWETFWMDPEAMAQS